MNRTKDTSCPEARIMMIDDDADNIEGYRYYLEYKYGFQNFTAYLNSTHALEKLAEFPMETDVVLLDLRMPQVNGLDVLDRIEAISKKAGKNLPVIILSAYSNVKGIRESLDKLAFIFKYIPPGQTTSEKAIIEKSGNGHFEQLYAAICQAYTSVSKIDMRGMKKIN